MKLIKEIRNDIIDSDVSLSVALRKAKVLASILKDQEFKEWVDHELSGYPDGAELPSYRILSVQIIGTFSGPFGSGAENVSVPIWKMRESFQKMYGRAELRSGVKELESLADSESGVVAHRWPAEAVAMWNMEYENEAQMSLIGASTQFSSSGVEGVLDTARNRLLDFILELKEINPEIEDSEEAISDISKEEVRNVFNYTIYGSHNVVAGGEEVQQNVTQTVSENDLNALVSYFQDLGMSDEDTDALVTAIEEDDGPPEGNFGDKVQSWIGRMITKASRGAWKVGMEAAPKLLTQGLANYYGWGGTP